jgi:hypothetical protein
LNQISLVLQSARLRPKSRHTTDLPKQEILKRPDERLKERKYTLTGILVQEYAFIRIPEKNQYYWPPEMHVWAREEENKTIVYGNIGPKPKIWTMFIFFYTIILVLTFFGAFYGIIQLILGIKADFIWSITIGLLALTLVYVAAYFGQHKGKEQMLLLQNFLDVTIKDN